MHARDPAWAYAYAKWCETGASTAAMSFCGVLLTPVIALEVAEAYDLSFLFALAPAYCIFTAGVLLFQLLGMHARSVQAGWRERAFEVGKVQALRQIAQSKQDFARWNPFVAPYSLGRLLCGYMQRPS